MRRVAVACLPLVLAACAATPRPPPRPGGALPAAPRWGADTGGLRVRVDGPRAVLRGDRVEIDVEVQVDPRELPEGVRTLDARGPVYFAHLVLAPTSGADAVQVGCVDPTGGMPDPPAPPDGPGLRSPDGYPLLDLRAETPRPCRVAFPLATAWDRVTAGSYLATVELRYVHRDQLGFDRVRGDWTGVVRSAPFPLAVAPAPDRVQEVQLPSAAIGGDAGGTVTLRLPVRNGFTVGLRGETLLAGSGPGDGFARLVREHVVPGSGPWEIFETSYEGEHMWSPGPGRGHYRTLWRATAPPTPDR